MTSPGSISLYKLIELGHAPYEKALDSITNVERNLGRIPAGAPRARFHYQVAVELAAFNQVPRALDHLIRAHAESPELYGNPVGNEKIQEFAARLESARERANKWVNDADRGRKKGDYSLAFHTETEAARCFLEAGDLRSASDRLEKALEHSSRESDTARSIAEVASFLSTAADRLDDIAKTPVDALANTIPSVVISAPQRTRTRQRSRARVSATETPATRKTSAGRSLPTLGL